MLATEPIRVERFERTLAFPAAFLAFSFLGAMTQLIPTEIPSEEICITQDMMILETNDSIEKSRVT